MIGALIQRLGIKAILGLVGAAAILGVVAHYRYIVTDRAELKTELAVALIERESFKQAMVISQEAARQYAAQRDADRRSLDDLRSRLNKDDLREWAEQPLPPALVCRWKGEQCVE